MNLSGRKSKNETIKEALEEYVLRREKKQIIRAFGTVDYYDEYKPKKYRSR
jgi:metal-responsive CopG/Arc/MetJ family transcriptional regulator